MNDTILLSVSLGTSAVGAAVLWYLRHTRDHVRTHMLRNEEVNHYFKRL